MDARFAWKPAYETGDERVDRQHQELLVLGGLLSEAVECGLGEEVVDEAVQALLDYVDYHFRDEERYMRSIACDLFQAHCREHRHLAAELSALAEDRDLGFSRFEHELLKWLETRLIPHMTNDDMQAFGLKPRPGCGG